jgi:hypothetical protein
MEIRVVTDAEQVPERDWNALATSVYQTRGWFLANQRHWSGTGFTYFAAYDGDALRAVLPVFDRPGEFYVGPARLLFGAPSRIASTLEYAIVGSPMSFDSEVIGDGEFLGALVDRARSHLRSGGADIIAFPFCRAPVRRAGIVSRRSVVDFDLALPGDGFDDYLASLSRRRRGEVRREIRAGSSLRFEDRPLAGHEHIVARFRRMAAERHGRFADLEPSFYKLLADSMGERSRVLVAIASDGLGECDAALEGEGGRIIGVSCYLEHAGSFYLLHGGAVRDRFAYFNLTFYELMRQAYRRGVRFINFRPASDEAKSNRGCTPVRTVACFEPISARGRAAMAVLLPALDGRRWVRRRLRGVWRAWRRRGSAGAGPASGSRGASGSRS